MAFAFPSFEHRRSRKNNISKFWRFYWIWTEHRVINRNFRIWHRFQTKTRRKSQPKFFLIRGKIRLKIFLTVWSSIAYPSQKVSIRRQKENSKFFPKHVLLLELAEYLLYGIRGFPKASPISALMEIWFFFFGLNYEVFYFSYFHRFSIDKDLSNQKQVKNRRQI